MSEKQLNLSNEEQVAFFLPILEDHFDKLTSAIGETQDTDLSDADWFVILSSKKSGKLLNHHYLAELWDNIAEFLKKRVKLYFFMDAKSKGLVGKTYTFWSFFSPATAAEYFKRAKEKPTDFGPQNIKPVPYPDLVSPLTAAVDTSMSINLANNAKILEKVNDLISLAGYFLDKDTLVAFDFRTKRLVSEFLSNEIERLKTDIGNPAVSPTLLQKRLRLTLKLCWRYFREKNELESTYFKKLLSEEAQERMKGLKLASKKVTDYIANPTG